MPHGRTADVIARQLLRAGTSVGADYRAACRARSRREFVAKLGIVEEETDEAQFWLDIAAERGLADPDRVSALADEARQLVAIIEPTLSSDIKPELCLVGFFLNDSQLRDEL